MTCLECDKPAASRGLCRACSQRHCRAGTLESAALPSRKKKHVDRPECLIIDCDITSRSRDLCSKHYQRALSLKMLDTIADIKVFPPKKSPGGTCKLDLDKAKREHPAVLADQKFLMRDDDYFYGVLGVLCAGSQEFQQLVKRKTGVAA